LSLIYFQILPSDPQQKITFERKAKTKRLA
jgi:hypothetical protein